jgi:hypothetical protein
LLPQGCLPRGRWARVPHTRRCPWWGPRIASLGQALDRGVVPSAVLDEAVRRQGARSQLLARRRTQGRGRKRAEPRSRPRLQGAPGRIAAVRVLAAAELNGSGSGPELAVEREELQ